MDEMTVGEVFRSLTRIETDLQKALADQEHRLRRVERLIYIAVGIALAGGTAGGSAFLSAMGGG